MNNFSLISVIVPVYNAERTVETCLNSILMQDYPNFEVILIDDGSKDASFSVCKKFADSNDNVFVQQFENAGAAEARNRGIRAARGEYVAFVDSDDIILPGYLTYLYGLTKEFGADIAVCGYRKMYNNKITHESANDCEGNNNNNNTDDVKSDESAGKWDYNENPCNENKNKCIGNSIIRNYKDNGGDFKISYDKVEAVKNLLYQRHFISAPWAMLSKKSLWDNVSFPKGKRAEDMATIYRLFAQASSVAYGGSKQYIYMQSSTNTVFSTQSVLNPDYYEHCINMTSYIKDNMPEALPAARSRLFSACFQILSETACNNENTDFINKIYGTIRDIRGDIVKDCNGKPRNRIAAALSFISIRMLHGVLRGFYKLKTARL